MYGYFEFGGIKSIDKGLIIDVDQTFSSPQSAGDFVEIPGVDGEIFISDNRLLNTSKSFTCYLFPGADQQNTATELSQWLKTNAGWKDLMFSGDQNYIYKAIYTEEYEVTSNIMEYGKTVLTFTIKPYKFLKTGSTETALPATITNPTNRNARPKMVIKGTGNITINIGTSTLTLKNVDGGVVVDSLAQTITTLDGTRPAWDKMTSYPFPVIAPGKQTILKTGTITDVKIIPRFEVIV